MDLDIGDTGELDLGPLWLRRLTWDTLPCDMVIDVQRELGLVPYGDVQQEEADHRASHARVNLIVGLAESVEYLSPFLARVLTKAIVAQMDPELKDQLTPELEEKLTGQNSELVRAATITMLMQFMSTGVLDYAKRSPGNDV